MDLRSDISTKYYIDDMASKLEWLMALIFEYIQDLMNEAIR